LAGAHKDLCKAVGIALLNILFNPLLETSGAADTSVKKFFLGAPI
jgi:hypothetical protein